MTSRSAPSAQRVAFAFALLTGCGQLPPAVAEPLPKDQCESLAAERALLEGGGAGENIVRGPEWGKTNLTSEQIAYIRRLIAVREDLLFRCRTYEPVLEAPPPSSAPADAPVPGRKPVTKPAPGKDNVPPPERPQRIEAKAAPGGESAAERKPEADGVKTAPRQEKKAAKAKDKAKPKDDALKLRGTLAAPTKPESEGAGASPAPEPPAVPARAAPTKSPVEGPKQAM